MRRIYLVTRDLHLYFGLFLSPFILLFSLSVFWLVHGLARRTDAASAEISRSVSGLTIAPGTEKLEGRTRVDALRPLLDRIGVRGEVDFIRHIPGEHRLIIPVRVPGRETTVSLDYERGMAVITSRRQSLGELSVYLHKTPGPHNVNVRGNSWFMSVWRILADATVYMFLFITISGVYLWAVLRAERRAGLALIAAGAGSFSGLVYLLVG